MSWLSDLGGTLGAMGSVLGAFVPGVGQAIAGIGGLLAMTDDPDALILFPGEPFEPGGMAYGLARTEPNGGPDETGRGRGFYIDGSQWTAGPLYKMPGSPYAHELWGGYALSSNQPTDTDELGSDNFLSIDAKGRVRGRVNPAGTRQPEVVAEAYAMAWGIDLETIAGQRLLLFSDTLETAVVYRAPQLEGLERGSFHEVVRADRAAAVAAFWMEQWETQEAPVFDSSVADIRTWDEDGGGAIQTWVNEVSLWGESAGAYAPNSQGVFSEWGNRAEWKNLQTPNSVVAFEAWEARRETELSKWDVAAYSWYQQKAEQLAANALSEYQAQQAQEYWDAWNSAQDANTDFISYLTGEEQEPTYLPPPPAPLISGIPPVQGSPVALESEQIVSLQGEALTVGEEEAIGIGAAAAALLIL